MRPGWSCQSSLSTCAQREQCLTLHCAGCQGYDLLHPVSNAWVHGGAPREDVVSIEVLPDVNITLHDAVIGGFVDARRLHSNERWLEEGLRAAEAFVPDGDHLPVRQFVALLQGRRGSSSGHFIFKVQSDIAQLLLDVTDNLTLSYQTHTNVIHISVRTGVKFYLSHVIPLPNQLLRGLS